jgi:hypothetical protein
MNLAIAITLAALIALIGVANPKFKGNLTWTNVSFNFRKRRFVFLTRSWIPMIPAAAAVALAAFAVSDFGAHHLLGLLGLGTSGVLFGVNTLNWQWPNTGATGPTAAQVANQDSVVVNVTTDGTLTSQVLTHNLNISAADITNGWPDVFITPINASGIPATLLIVLNQAATTANAITLTFAAVVGTFRVKIARPHSIGR